MTGQNNSWKEIGKLTEVFGCAAQKFNVLAESLNPGTGERESQNTGKTVEEIRQTEKLTAEITENTLNSMILIISSAAMEINALTQSREDQ